VFPRLGQVAFFGQSIPGLALGVAAEKVANSEEGETESHEDAGRQSDEHVHVGSLGLGKVELEDGVLRGKTRKVPGVHAGPASVVRLRPFVEEQALATVRIAWVFLGVCRNNDKSNRKAQDVHSTRSKRCLRSRSA
jgi:hypothetical protein